MSKVAFCKCTQTEYDSAVKDLNSVYFCEDTGRIYKGPSRMSVSLLDNRPVGSLYLSVNDDDPTYLFGGVWQRLDEGFLYSSSGSDFSFRTDGIAISQNTRQAIAIRVWTRTA